MSSPFRLVLIDDDPDLRKLVKLTLEFTAGWQILAAAGGAEGIELVRRHRPDAVLVDLMMPEMDGYDVCRRLSADSATAAIPRVLLTARREVDEDRMREVGAAGVVLKPFDPDDLARQVRELCGPASP
jgi:CheY-like chemotaxis protein